MRLAHAGCSLCSLCLLTASLRASECFGRASPRPTQSVQNCLFSAGCLFNVQCFMIQHGVRPTVKLAPRIASYDISRALPCPVFLPCRESAKLQPTPARRGNAVGRLLRSYRHLAPVYAFFPGVRPCMGGIACQFATPLRTPQVDSVCVATPRSRRTTGIQRDSRLERRWRAATGRRLRDRQKPQLGGRPVPATPPGRLGCPRASRQPRVHTSVPRALAC